MVNQLQACIGSASVFGTFGTLNVSVNDDRVYTRGRTPVAVIELQPRLQHVRETFSGGHLHVWRIGVTVGAQWRSADQSASNLNAAWQSVLDQICKYPNLGLGAGNGVREAHVEAANLQPAVEEYGNLKFANVQLTVNITEDVHVAEAE
jgi:hypothetical protein